MTNLAKLDLLKSVEGNGPFGEACRWAAEMIVERMNAEKPMIIVLHEDDNMESKNRAKEAVDQMRSQGYQGICVIASDRLQFFSISPDMLKGAILILDESEVLQKLSDSPIVKTDGS